MIVMITSRIFTILQIKIIIRPFFCIITGHIPFSLLSNHIIYKTLLSLKVISHNLGLIRSFAIFENRCSLHHTQRIQHSGSMNRTAVHIHRNDIRCQFYLFVVDLALTI